MMRVLLASLLILTSMSLPESAAAATSRAAMRQSIRQQPILARPSRVGHVYGNTVRRMASVR